MIWNPKFRNYGSKNELCSGLAMYFPLNLIYYESGSKHKNGYSILILILRKAIKQAMYPFFCQFIIEILYHSDRTWQFNKNDLIHIKFGISNTF